MTLSGLKTIVIGHLLCFCFLLGVTTTLRSETLVGSGLERDIKLDDSESSTPSWKGVWDVARQHVKAEQYQQAALAYSELFRQKSNIEEANWEYCKVLQKTGDYKTGAKIVAALLEKTTNRAEYYLIGGHFASVAQDWKLSATYFGKVLEKDPLGLLSEKALEGLRESMHGLGKKEIAFSLAEHLVIRQPANLLLQKEMALEAFSLGHPQKARFILKKLLAKKDVDDKILLQLASVFDVPGYENEISILFSQYLKKHPEYHSFRKKLIEICLTKGEHEAALSHLVYLVNNLGDNDDYLLKAGTIALHQLGRPDKALTFYERFFQKHPDNTEIQKKIANIQHILANDFLSIVENDGAWLLWRDLAKITPNRLAIYLQMADILQKKGMSSEYLEILAIIHSHYPDDNEITLRLAQQYFDNKQFEQALDCLENGFQKTNKTKSYYVLRSSSLMELGRDNDALIAYQAALQLDEGDLELRKSCMKLAGSLGDVKKLQILFAALVKNHNRQPDYEAYLIYLEQLAKNYLFHEYIITKNRHRLVFDKDKSRLDDIDLHFVKTLRREGKTRLVEQLLRQYLQENRAIDKVLLLLIENALTDKNISAAKTWLAFYEKKSAVGEKSLIYEETRGRRLLFNARIAKIKGNYATAEELLEGFVKDTAQKQMSKEMRSLRVEIVKEQCWLSFYREDYKTSLHRLEEFFNTGIFDPEIITLYRILARKLKVKTINDQKIESNYLSGHQRISHLIEIIESDLKHQEFESAENRLKIVLKESPESVVAKTLWTNLLFARGRFGEATEALVKLHKQYPEEPYFFKKLIEAETRQGKYDKGLSMLEAVGMVVENGAAQKSDPSSVADIEMHLIKARLLWGAKEYEKALQVYGNLLVPSVQQVIKKQFDLKQLHHLYSTSGESVWESMKLLLQSESETIERLMEPSFFVENITNEAGKIVADHYELFSWQKMITTEYLARKAIYEKNYYYAEQNYKKMMDEQGASEELIDLATMYGRAGKYRKEAQVYEAIQTTGVATSTDLENSIQRSSVQLSPQSILEASYSEREGRNGFIDMATMRSGASFWFTPALDKDIRLIYTNNRYESKTISKSAESNKLYGLSAYEFAQDVELTLGGGLEKFADTSSPRFLYQIGLRGQLDEYFHAYIEWEKELVSDSVASLEDDISTQDIETGLYCESQFGLTLGGDFRHRSYSDNNSQNRFHAFSSYGLFSESVHVSLRYDYQYLTSADTNPSAFESRNDDTQDIFSYWSPASFSENLLTLHFQHDFLGYEQGSKRGISYYALDNIIGYEDLENITYMGKFDIFLEMNPHFLLKGNFTFAKSDIWEEKELALSLHYRW